MTRSALEAGSTPRRRPVRGTARTWTGLVAAVLLAVTACAPELPEPQPDPVPAAPPPVMSVEQAEGILAELAEVLAAGDEALDVDLLRPRVAGPALSSRAAHYTIAKELEETDVLTALPTEAQALIVPDDATWPRTVVVVTEQPEDLQSPRLLVLRQEDARSQYVLWGWTRLLPGVQMPRTADPTIGSPVLPPDAEGFVGSPAEVAAWYAEILSEGQDAEQADLFTEDVASQAIIDARTAFAEAVDEAGGELTEKYTPGEDEVFAFGTADGGALVIAGLRTTTAVTLEDSTLTLSGNSAALLGEEEITSELSMRWVDVIAFHVPAADSGEKIEVLAAEHVLTRVRGE